MNGTEENRVRKSALAWILLALSIVLLVSSQINVREVKAQGTDYTIENVDHRIRVLYDGYVIMNDTIKISGKAPSGSAYIDRFPIGFPNEYGQHVLRCLAYDATDTFEVLTNVPLENRIGFYGLEVNFLRSLNVSNGAEHIFNVVIVFSNDLVQQDAENTSSYTLSFPAYPSLTQTVAVCNGSVVLPGNATYVDGTTGNFTFGTANLPAMAYEPASIHFLLSGDIQLFEVKQLERKIEVDEFNGIKVSDTYHIRNKSSADLSYVNLLLPLNASNPSAQDQLGGAMTSPELVEDQTGTYMIFVGAVKPSNSTFFTIIYSLPSQIYHPQQSAGSDQFSLRLPMFYNLTYYIEEASVSFVFPEGARIVSFEKSSVGADYGAAEGIFKEALSLSIRDILFFDGFDFNVVYEYNPLWASFRPTLWAWVLGMIGCVAAVLWRRPKAPTRVTVPATMLKLRPEDIKTFIDAYEEKLKVSSEIDSLEARVQKGRIPRRRYKVQRKVLETRLHSLNRDSAELREKMRRAGGHYSELTVQLEVAESEMNEVEANLKNLETLHSQGSLSLEAYRKRLEDYQRRKEKADTAINGVLLRLREEIR